MKRVVAWIKETRIHEIAFYVEDEEDEEVTLDDITCQYSIKELIDLNVSEDSKIDYVNPDVSGEQSAHIQYTEDVPEE